ncbi:MAG: protein phosphatase 2C domain-containing protein [Prevotella sp.]|nr:protein phosphatase 2C domain-containing protein [Prevotella sp.]
MKYTFLKPQAIFELGRRSNQEDCIYPAIGMATPDDRLFIVCDGMGGHEKGEVASNVICKSLSDFVKNYAPADEVFTDDRFKDGLAAAASDLKAAVQNPGDEQMGTTLVFLYFHRGGCFAAHIGDSRYYHFRPTTGEIVYRSKDHSLVTELYETGEITKAEQMTADCRNILTRAMMPANEQQSQHADIVHITDIRPGDWFGMFTDGIIEDLTDSELLSIFCDLSLSDVEKCERLRQLTAGNSDNHSGYMIHISDVEAEPLDAGQPNDEAAARAVHKAFNDNSPERVAEVVTVAEQSVAAAPVTDNDDVTLVGPAPAAPPQLPRGGEPAPEAQPAPVQPSPQPGHPTPQAAYRQSAPKRGASAQTKFLWALVALLLLVVAFLLYLTLSKNDDSEHFQGPREKTESSLETPTEKEKPAETKSPTIVHEYEYVDEKVPQATTTPAKPQETKPQTQAPQPEKQPETQPAQPSPATSHPEPVTTPQPTETPQPTTPALSPVAPAETE